MLSEQAEEHLRAAEATYRILVEHLPAIAYVAAPDLSGSFLYVSPQVETILGFSAAEWLGNPRLWLEQVHSDDYERVMADLSRSLTAGEPLVSEYRALTRDGRELWFRHQGTLVRRPPVAPPVDCSTDGATPEDQGARGNGSAREAAPDNAATYTLGFMLEITARKRAEESLAYQALHDAVTGLPNRVLLNDRLRHAIRAAQRTGTRLGLLLMDLDHFKEVNDALGHHVGDNLLQQVGQRVQSTVRASDTVARLGGDEFAIVLPGVLDRGGAVLAASKIIAALAQPFLIERLPILVTPSIGVVLYPDHGADAPTLLQHADIAMYVAKRSGGGSTVYTRTQNQHTPSRLALISGLRSALDEDQLLLHYQPKIDLRNGCVQGVEALTRWQHPEQGLVPPDSFIPLAEQAGLIKAITLWSLDTALKQCRAWCDAGQPLSVAVNLSARYLQDPQLTKTIARMLQSHGVEAANLTVEITESVLMADPEQACKILTEVSTLGVRLAIDDFGTGYSSLAYLERLPMHEIKIDKSFVAKLSAQDSSTVIVRSIIGLGHNLGLTVVAEGVETRATWELVDALGCDVVQGYYISRPLPVAEATRWLGTRPLG
jgi:diguanylate cyclase (GGDEF)-like protein/PAS domain S-box-containing protein